jgi:hypothetical protein
MYLELSRLSNNQISEIRELATLSANQKTQLGNILSKGKRNLESLKGVNSIDEKTARPVPSTSQNKEIIVDTISTVGEPKQFVYDHMHQKYYILHEGSVIGLPMNSSGVHLDKKNRVALFVSLVNLGSKNGNLVTLGSAKMLERLDPQDFYGGNSVEGLKEYLDEKGQRDHYKCSYDELKLYLQLVKSGVRQYNFEIDGEMYKFFYKVDLCCLNALSLDTSEDNNISMQLELIKEYVEEKKNDDISNPRGYKKIFLDCRQVLTILDNNPDLLLGNLDKFNTHINSILIDEEMSLDAKKEWLRLQINDREILGRYRSMNDVVYRTSSSD